MSRPRNRWWGFARRMTADYPGLKRAHDALCSQSVTPRLTPMPSGGGTSRPAEVAALRTLPPDDQDAYDAVSRAIAMTSCMETGPERLNLIRLMYWSRSNVSMRQAADIIGISEPTAKRWHAAFIRTVGISYGFSPKDDTPEPK